MDSAVCKCGRSKGVNAVTCKPCRLALLAEKRKRICTGCGKEFVLRPHIGTSGGRKGTYCSRECAFENRYEKIYDSDYAKRLEQKRRDRAAAKLLGSFVCCSNCKMPFVRKRGRRSLLCSVECRTQHELKYRFRNELKRRGIDEPTCEICGDGVACSYEKGVKIPGRCDKCKAFAIRRQRRTAKRKRQLLRSGGQIGRYNTNILIAIRKKIADCNSQCPMCGLLMTEHIDFNHRSALNLDHSIPISRGGDDKVYNIQPLCRRCNELKGTFMPMSEFGKQPLPIFTF